MFQNLFFQTILFGFFHISIQNIHQNQPTFHSPTTIWKIHSQINNKHSVSPFYKNEQAIIFQIQRLISRQQEEKALELLKLVVKTERSWRLQMCIRVFGFKACDNNASENVVPFYLWKKRMIHHLRTDPTHEIIQQIKNSLQFETWREHFILNSKIGVRFNFWIYIVKNKTNCCLSPKKYTSSFIFAIFYCFLILFNKKESG